MLQIVKPQRELQNRTNGSKAFCMSHINSQYGDFPCLVEFHTFTVVYSDRFIIVQGGTIFNVVTVICYTYDTKVSYVTKKSKDAIYLQYDISTKHKWLEENDMQLNDEKYQILFY